MNKVTVQYIDNINYLLVSKEFFTHYHISHPTLTLKVGSWTKDIPVKYSYQMDSSSIGLPTHLLPFDLPDTLSYEVRFDNQTLHIGPIIGMANMIVSKKFL